MKQQRFGDVSVEMRGPVALVEIHRPPHNFFDLALIRSLAGAYEAADADPDCRVLVLASDGKAFCAGADFQAGSLDDTVADGGSHLYAEALRLFSCRKPVVAAVQGPAIGGGLGLAVSADFRVAAPEARFAANFVKLGIHPGFGLTHTLPQLIGAQKAALLFYTGRRIGADEALAWGLVDLVVPQAQLRESAIRLAAEMAEGAPLALQSTRKTLRGDLAGQVKLQTDREYAEQQWLARTEDHAEGIRAVAERRPGNFKGR